MHTNICMTATYKHKKNSKKKNKKNSKVISIFMSTIHVKTRLNCTKIKAIICKCKLQHDHTSASNNKWYAYSMYIIYTHIWTSFTTTGNSRLYNISAIRTVAQNTILIYSNTFFFSLFYNVQVQTVHTRKCKAQAPKGHKSACYQVSWKPLEEKDWHESANEKLPVSYRSFSTLPTAVSCEINS